MKIIVTGGAGFIASHVVDAYIKAGHSVTVIDNLSSGTRKNLNPRANFYKADIRNLNALRRIFANEQPDVVNHHAAFISVTESVKEPARTFDINATGTLKVLLAFAESIRSAHPARATNSKREKGMRGKKFLFSSTGGAIYGNPRHLPADETTPPNPLSPYALTKVIDENLIKYFCPAYNIEYVIFRYANVYGPRQRAQGGAGIFPIFTESIKKGIRPTIFGNGGKTRDYVYVEDVARASVLGLRRGHNETVNISTGREVTDDAVYKSIARALNFPEKPLYIPTRPGEVRRISMSYAKAHRLLGWQPKTNFEKGVGKALR